MENGKLNRWVLAGIGLAEGLAFYLLTRPDWDNGLHWLFAGAVVAAFVPLALQLTWGIGSNVKAAIASLLIGVLLAGLWLWLDGRVQWDLAEGSGEWRGFENHIMIFIFAANLAAYILLPYVQTWLEVEGLRFPYTSLFRFSWNNILVVVISALFLGVFWLVLLLWWELFNLVGVGVFEDLFTGDAFAWCFSGAVLGLGIAIARENPRIVPILRRIVLMLFQVLAPVLAIASILFLAFLPFTGLETLWNTGSATGVLVTLIFVLVLMTNAVVQDGEQEGMFGTWLNRLMAVALVLLPIYAGLAFYATWLRIDQYGLTPERFLAKVIVVMAAIHAVSYAFGVLRYRGGWAKFVYMANPKTALVVAGAALLISTPLLDPYGRSASNQLVRLQDGRADAETFDYGALKFNFGAPGRVALAEIGTWTDHPQQAVIDTRLEEVTIATYYRSTRQRDEDTKPASRDALVVRPEGAELPDDLWVALNEQYSYRLRECSDRGTAECGVLLADLTGDGHDDAILFSSDERNNAVVFIRPDGGGAWRYLDYLKTRDGEIIQNGNFWQAFIDGDYELVEPATFDIRLGDKTLRY